MTASEIPTGFEPHFRKAPFTDPWEPLYSKKTASAVIMGLRLAKPHTNARGLIKADDAAIARASAIFRVVPKPE